MQTFKRLFIENYFKVLLGDFDLTQPAPAEAERRKVFDQNPDQNHSWNLFFSADDLPFFQVRQIIAHHQFDSRTFDFDFALIQIEK